jgi:hypothetical protein
MFRLRYVLLAVLLLAAAPWVLDGLPPLSCLIPTVNCPEEGIATVSDDSNDKSASVSAGVRSNSTGIRKENAASSQAGSNDVPVRSPMFQVAPGASTPYSAAPKPENKFRLTATGGFGGIVTIKWHVPDENGVDYYLLDRKLQSDPDDAFERQIALQAVDGSEEYTLTDTPASDTYTYRLRALAWTDQSDAGKALGTADVAVEYVIGLTVGHFALGAASGLVSVNWTAAQEGGVVSYVLDRKPEGAEAYDLDVEIGYPQGDGIVYSLYDDPHGTGTYIYRLRAKLSNGTDRVLAEGGVTL